MLKDLIGKEVFISVDTEDEFKKYLAGKLLEIDNNFIKLESTIVTYINLAYVIDITEKQN
jgi:hypothetical protein